MRALIQWATTTPSDWVEYDLNGLQDVRKLPRKPVPDGSEVIDDQPGWAMAVNVQGVIFTSDHVGFKFPGAAEMLVAMWNDDPEDWPAVPFGQVVVFDQPALDPSLMVVPGIPTGIDPETGEPALFNTVQTLARFADQSVLEANVAAGEAWAQRWLDDPDTKPWSDFPNFAKTDQLHGVWLSDELYNAHNAIQSLHPWMEWV